MLSPIGIIIIYYQILCSTNSGYLDSKVPVGHLELNSEVPLAISQVPGALGLRSISQPDPHYNSTGGFMSQFTFYLGALSHSRHIA